MKYILVFMLVVSMFVSCDELVDEEPISEISPSNFWRNNNDAEVGVMGVYDAMQTAYRSNYFKWGEMRSDNYIRGAVSALQNDIEVVHNNVTPGNDNVTRWNVMYALINRANFAIQKIPEIPSYDENLLGEALLLRAYTYFTMVKVWGDVPLFLEPTLSVGSELYKPRTAATTILETVIIPDMIRGEQLIGIPNREFRWSKASAFAFQADVYMWLNEHAKAKVALDKLIGLNAFSLVTTAQAWESMFYNNPPDVQRLMTTVNGESQLGRGKEQFGSELIFSIFYDQSEPRGNLGDGNGNRSAIMSIFLAGLPAYYISPELENKWRDRFPIDSLSWVTKYKNVKPVLSRPDVVVNPTTGELTAIRRPVYGDFRFYFSREFNINEGSKKIGEARVAKWQQFNVNGNFDDTNIPIYRYAGQLLLLAEAENKLGNTTRSLALLNQIRTARGLPLVTLAEFGATIENREEYILDERQFELLGEGQRAFDLIRTGRFVETMNAVYESRGVQLIDANKILLPIYFEHFQENPNLGNQNPGYN